MKRREALETIAALLAWLTDRGGVLDTPGGRRPHFVVKELWLFGSVVMGRQFPSDIDILLMGHDFGKVDDSSRTRSYRVAVEVLRAKFGSTLNIEEFSIFREWDLIPAQRVLIYPRDDFGLTEQLAICPNYQAIDDLVKSYDDPVSTL